MTTNRARAAEDEYFARLELEQRRGRGVDRERQTAAADRADRERLRALHSMRCPKCGMALESLTLEAVKLDRCRSCRGTWLDEGELLRLAHGEPGLLRRLAGKLRA